MQRAFSLFCLITAAVLGFAFGSGQMSYSFHSGANLISGIHPELEFPPSEYKSFAIVVYAQNDALWCEETLRSIFSQDYDYFRVILVDDGSVDGTLQKAKDFIVASAQEHRVLVMQNETPCGLNASLYRAATHCHDREILVPLSAKDWMVGPGVLSHWNRAFQNPDVWIAFGRSIAYPSYDLQEPPSFDLKEVAKKGWKVPESKAHCFYSALFKQIPVQNLKGHYLVPLLELSGGRTKNVWESLVFANEAIVVAASVVPSHSDKPLEPLTAFPKNWNHESLEVDGVVFSHNQPLRLFAALEALERYGKGLRRITAVYWADPAYGLAYAQLKTAFPEVLFLPQGKEFKRSFFSRIFETPSQYILWGSDEILAKEPLELSKSADLLRRTKAQALFLSGGQRQEKTSLADGVYATKGGKGPNHAMILYPKTALAEFLKTVRYQNYADIENQMSGFVQKEAICLWFDEPKTMPLKVGREEELLSKFNQGLKIDLEGLFRGETPEFILR